jgi:outer membrane lipoprotein-sorting protein
MRRILALLSAFFLALSAFAQTPGEIVAKMEETIGKTDTNGMVMSMDMKIPILGTITSRVWTLGEKTRIEGKIKGEKWVSFMDGDTEWQYSPEDNKVRIKHYKLNLGTTEASNAKMFDGVSDGYDISLDKETASAWFLQCKKKKGNKDKDAPKTMDLVVAKGSFYPLSLSAKASGITIKMYDLGFDVTENQVTFNPADFPGATIIDER